MIDSIFVSVIVRLVLPSSPGRPALCPLPGLLLGEDPGCSALGEHPLLAIASDAPEILNLPWELLLPPEGEFPGLDPLFAIRRLPGFEKKLDSFRASCGPAPCACIAKSSAWLMECSQEE